MPSILKNFFIGKILAQIDNISQCGDKRLLEKSFVSKFQNIGVIIVLFKIYSFYKRLERLIKNPMTILTIKN